MTRSGAAIRILASVGIAVATLYGVFVGGAWSGIHSSTLRSTTLVVALVALGLWGVTAILAPAWRPRSRILPALLVPLSVLALTTGTSRQPRLGLDYVAWSVILVALYLLLVRLMANPWFRPRMQILVTTLALIVGIWYLQQVGSTWIEWWGLVGRISPPPLRPEFAGLTFGNPSAVMTISVLLSLPSAAWTGFATRGRAALSVILLVLTGTSTILSGSRAGWLGLALGSAFVAAIWLSLSGNRAAVARVVTSEALRRTLAGVIVVGAVIAAVLLPGLVGRFSAGGEGLRLAYYKAALRMFADSSIVGTGPGTWVAQRIAFTDVPDNDYYIPHAHDVYLQVLAEMGIVGVLAGIVVVMVLGRLLVRAIRSGERSRIVMGWATLLALAYFAGHQLLDVYANAPAMLLAMAVPIAWLDAVDMASSPSGDPSAEARSRIVKLSGRAATIGPPIALAVVVIGAIGWLRHSEEAAAVEAQAVEAVNRGRDVDALDYARAAVALDPDIASDHVTLGLATSRTGHLDEAAIAFRRASALDDLPESWLGLAHAQFGQGDHAAARTSLVEALRLGIAQPAVVVGAADLDQRLGDMGGVDAMIQQAIVEIPGLAGDPTLLGLEPDGARRDAIVGAAMNRLIGTTGAVEAALESGRSADVDRALAALSATDRGWFDLVVRAWNGDREAEAALGDRARATPLDPTIVAWCTRLAGRRGDVPQVTRYTNWFRIIYGNTVPGMVEVRTARTGLNPGDSTGSTATFYGHYTYRRPTPWNLIAGDLLRLMSP